MNIATFEHNNGISVLIKRYFDEDDIKVTRFKNFEEIILSDISNFDLILIDMSHTRCIELITYIKQTTNIPVIYLTERYKKNIFESQIDDEEFVIHSYTREEFIEATFKKLGELKGQRVLDLGNIKLEESNNIVKVKGSILNLSKVDVNICSILIKNDGKPMIKEDIIKNLEKRGMTSTQRAIREHIRKIRVEFQKCGYAPIETVVKEGYRWVIYDTNDNKQKK
ncbi:MAG: winged helix-turn-helix domain-containing protein [Tissierellia bacterium]|nr:winged helix-turn-helix domain-containing protein [Tissierellia bacterium]